MSKYQSKYIAFVIGEGEGCDYTMACNRNLFPIMASTKEDAEEVLFKMLYGVWSDSEGDWGERGLDDDDSPVAEVYLFEVKAFSNNLIDVMRQRRANFIQIKTEQRNAEQAQKQEEADRLEYERLKAKFGDK